MKAGTGTGPMKAPPSRLRNSSIDRVLRRLRVDVDQAAQAAHGRQRHDEGLQVEARDERAVQDADRELPSPARRRSPPRTASAPAGRWRAARQAPPPSRPRGRCRRCRITISMPRLRKPLVTICREMLTMLRWVRNASEATLAKTTSSTIAAAKSRSARLKRCSRGGRGCAWPRSVLEYHHGSGSVPCAATTPAAWAKTVSGRNALAREARRRCARRA